MNNTLFNVKVLSVEWHVIPEGEPAMTKLMESNGFIKLGLGDLGYAYDVVYMKDYLANFGKNE